MESKSQPAEDENLRSLIEDLEESIEVNNRFIADIINSKISHDNSIDTDCTVIIPLKAYQLLLEENKRLQDAIERMSEEEKRAKASIESEEKYLSDSKSRKKERSRQAKEQIEKIRQETLAKESQIQELEAEAAQLENEIQTLEHNDPVEPEVLIHEAKKLLKKIKKDCSKAEQQKNQAILQCRELENEIKKFSNVIKAAGGQVALCTEAILAKDHLLDVNYENYWFGEKQEPDDDSFEDTGSRFNKKYGGELRKLELAYQIKNDELKSVNRILKMLETNNTYLSKAVEKKRSF